MSRVGLRVSGRVLAWMVRVVCGLTGKVQLHVLGKVQQRVCVFYPFFGDSSGCSDDNGVHNR